MNQEKKISKNNAKINSQKLDAKKYAAKTVTQNFDCLLVEREGTL